MVIKRLRIPLLLMAVVLVLSSATPMMVSAAASELPAGFTGMDSVNLSVDSDYPWHKMTDEEATAYELEAYKGTDVYIAGNSKRVTRDNTASNLAITVSEPGELVFEYALSASVDSSTDYMAYRIGSAIVAPNDDPGKENLTCIAQGEHRPTTTTWETYSISVDESNFAAETYVTIYIAFENYGVWENETQLNYAAIRNVTYITGGRDDVVKEYDTTMGAVTAQLVGDTLTDADLSDMAIGSTYRLTATANTGYQFYGWVKHNADGGKEYQTLASGKLDVSVDQTTTYEPIFAPTGTYILRNGTTFYDRTTSLKTAIESAASGDVLVLLKDATISEDIAVPEGVTLYIPFRANWEKEEAGYYDDYGNFILKYHLSKKGTGHTAISGENETYTRLTVNSGKTLSVNGNVVIGSVIGYASQRYQGHVSGAHGRITNNGTIAVNNGGTLKCYGIVDGSGVVHANDGGVLKESFIVGDFAGGANTAELFFTEQMPFKRFSMQSVQCTLTMEAQAKLMAMMSIWASSAFNEAEVVLVGDDAEAAFRPTSTSADTLALTRTYNENKSLADGNGLLDVTGIGRTEWTFSNGLVFQPLTVSLGGITVDTGASDFTIPYNFKIRLVSGTYSIPLGMRIMPGAEVVIESGATAQIGGRLMVMDGLIQSDMSTDRYPTRGELTAAGFSGSGELTLNGTLTMTKGAALGGLIKSNGGGTLVVEEGVYVRNTGTLSMLNQTKELASQDGSWFPSDGGVAVFDNSGKVVKINDWVQQDGALGEYDENTTWFNLPARIYTANGVQNVEPGKTYTAKAGSGTAEYTVEYLYVADGVYGSLGGGRYGYLTTSGKREMTSATETLSRSVNAVWTDGSQTEEMVEVTGVTVAGSDKESALTYNVTVAYDSTKNGANTVLSNLRSVDATTKEAKTEKYVYLVKYTVEGNATGYTLTPVDGVYTIPAEANGVIIESCLLGDITGDGLIKANDYKKLKSFILEKTTSDSVGEMGLLASDVSGDGNIKANDYKKLKSYILEKISSL